MIECISDSTKYKDGSRQSSHQLSEQHREVWLFVVGASRFFQVWRAGHLLNYVETVTNKEDANEYVRMIHDKVPRDEQQE